MIKSYTKGLVVIQGASKVPMRFPLSYDHMKNKTAKILQFAKGNFFHICNVMNIEIIHLHAVFYKKISFSFWFIILQPRQFLYCRGQNTFCPGKKKLRIIKSSGLHDCGSTRARLQNFFQNIKFDCLYFCSSLTYKIHTTCLKRS